MTGVPAEKAPDGAFRSSPVLQGIRTGSVDYQTDLHPQGAGGQEPDSGVAIYGQHITHRQAGGR